MYLIYNCSFDILVNRATGTDTQAPSDEPDTPVETLAFYDDAIGERFFLDIKKDMR